MTGVDSFVIVDEWVSSDLTSDVFTDEDARGILDDIDRLEQEFTVRDRSLTDAMDILTTQTAQTMTTQTMTTQTTQTMTAQTVMTQTTQTVMTQTTQTIYNRRQGDFRSFFVRDGSTLYRIGVGPRSTVYDRNLDTIQARGSN